LEERGENEKMLLWILCNVMGGRGGLDESGSDTENCRLLLNMVINHLTPNGHFSGRTAPLTYRCCIFYLFNKYTY
jgi:hypothetical protein